jgi:hypothetical protein
VVFAAAVPREIALLELVATAWVYALALTTALFVGVVVAQALVRRARTALPGALRRVPVTVVAEPTSPSSSAELVGNAA